jgi:hypothetical protein
MAQSYPIWIDVSGDNYKKDKSFGSREHVTMDIKVGSSKTYSNDLARVSIHMREDAAGNRTFALALDGLVVRSAVMTKEKKFWHRDPKAAWRRINSWPTCSTRSTSSGPGTTVTEISLKRQAASFKQASSSKLRKPQAASVKSQAASVKLEATSCKLSDHGPWKKFHGALTEVLY